MGHPGARLALTAGQLGRSQSTLKGKAPDAEPTPPGTLLVRRITTDMYDGSKGLETPTTREIKTALAEPSLV